MANVHGFGDQNNRANNNRNNNYRGLNPQQNISDSIPFINNTVSDRPPLQQTIPYTLKMICCPTIKPLSISVILSVIMCVLFVFCCTQGITKQNKNILEISADVLIDYGAAQDILVKRGQVHRLIVASFLHMNLLHIVMNMICFVFLLSRLQKTFKPQILMGILLGAGVAGNILSVLCNKTGTISAGASGIIFGIIGTYLAFMTINWQTLSAYGQIRSQLCCTVGMLVFFSILFSFGSDIDTLGHFGGMIGGYFMALAILPGIQQKSKRFYTIGTSCFSAYILITFLVFFLTS